MVLAYLLVSPFPKICMQVKEQQSELDMEQQTGSKWEKEYVRLYIVAAAAKLLQSCPTL